jgi:hypothetical protein
MSWAAKEGQCKIFRIFCRCLMIYILFWDTAVINLSEVKNIFYCGLIVKTKDIIDLLLII